MVIGGDYASRFERHCRQGWTDYALRHGYDLLVLTRPLDSSLRAESRPIYWQKNLVFEHEAVAKYRQVAWIDSDIVINAQAAPPIFTGVPEERVGAVDEYSSPDPATYRRALAATYLRFRRQGTPFLHNLTPEEYYRQRGLPPFGEVVQGGVLICSPRHHREVFRRVYDREHLHVPNSNAEMGALSFELLSRNLVTWIDHRFNRLVMLGIAEQLPLLSGDPGHPRTPLEIGAVRPILAQLAASSYFLHFAGCHSLMDHLPQRIS